MTTEKLLDVKFINTAQLTREWIGQHAVGSLINSHVISRAIRRPQVEVRAELARQKDYGTLGARGLFKDKYREFEILGPMHLPAFKVRRPGTKPPHVPKSKTDTQPHTAEPVKAEASNSATPMSQALGHIMEALEILRNMPPPTAKDLPDDDLLREVSRRLTAG